MDEHDFQMEVLASTCDGAAYGLGRLRPYQPKEAGAHARGEGNDSTAPTTSAPTLTRRGRGGAPASISSVSQPRTNVNEKEQAAIQKGDRDAVDKINKQQIKVARDALKMYKE